MKRIRAELGSRGYDVWIDLEQMLGSTVVSSPFIIPLLLCIVVFADSLCL